MSQKKKYDLKSLSLLFPHQLFNENPALKKGRPVFLVEEHLYFTHYKFHQQKILFHRASMKAYAAQLEDEGFAVHYVEATDQIHDIRSLIPFLAEKGCRQIHYTDPTDDWLSQRLQQKALEHEIHLNKFESPLFLNTPKDNKHFFKPGKKKYYQTSFYKQQRKKHNILMEMDDTPVGGKWSYDAENRRKYPKNKTPPPITFPDWTINHEEALQYVKQHFVHHLGEVNKEVVYPLDHKSASQWFENFLETRFHEFGDYEDALVKEELLLHHSLLSPLLNSGLLSPHEVIQRAMRFAEDKNVPMNTLEGFIRQILGWREFIRGVYEVAGRKERTHNFWGFDRKIPPSFYDGSTGIEPVDSVIQKVLKTGYCHHIERLMVLGNFMQLCEFDPDEVYRWFMELFIDAYDWVMVTNVYGMSQFADGGLMSTKPYISSSNYLMNMSNYKKAGWQDTWDALFWRFMQVNREFFQKNPRLSMLVSSYDKMGRDKQEQLLNRAEDFLRNLDENL